MYASNLPMVIMSRTLATLCRATRSAVNREAAIAGSAEFFAPLMVTVPRKGLPPLMRNLSMSDFRDGFRNHRRCCASPSAQRRLPPDFFSKRLAAAGARIFFQHDKSDPQIVSGLPQSAFGRGQILATGRC